MKRKSLYISIATFIILSLPVFSGKAVVQDENRLLIRMDKVAVVDDSLRLDGFFRIPRTQIPSTGKLMFTLSLEYGGQQLELPPVVIAGKRRMRYELREQTVNPDLRPEVQPAVTLPADWKKQKQWIFVTGQPYPMLPGCNMPDYGWNNGWPVVAGKNGSHPTC